MHVIQRVFPLPRNVLSTAHPVPYPACQMAPPVLSRNLPTPNSPSSPYSWRGTGRVGGRRRAPEWEDNGDEEKRGSLRKGKREGVSVEHGESFS